MKLKEIKKSSYIEGPVAKISTEHLYWLIEKLEHAIEVAEYYGYKPTYHCIDHGDAHEVAERTKNNYDHTPVYALDNKGDKARAFLKQMGIEGDEE